MHTSRPRAFTATPLVSADPTPFAYVGVDLSTLDLALLELRRETPTSPPTLGVMRSVDRTHYTHRLESESDCVLHPASENADRIVHFTQDHADLVAIVRQLSREVECVQTMLLAHCRAVVEAVSPRTLHAWLFGSRHGLDREERR